MVYKSPHIIRNTAATLIAKKLVSEGVTLMPMGEICSSITDGEHQTPPRQVAGIPLLTAKNVRDGYIDLTDTDFVSTESAEKSWKRCRAEAGDVLMACVGATLGRAATVKQSINAVLVRSVALLRPRRELVLPDYLENMLYTSRTEEQIHTLVKQSAQPGIYLKQINAIQIPVPTLDIQYSIVNFLRWCLSPDRHYTRPPQLPRTFQGVELVIVRIEELAAKIEEARELRREAVKEAEMLLPLASARAYDEANKIAGGVERLDDLCLAITDGTHVTPTYVLEGVPFLSVKDITTGTIRFEDAKYITPEEHCILTRRCKPERDDILLTKVGTTGFAKAIDVDREFSIFVSLALLKIDKKRLLPNYTEYMLNSPRLRELSAAGTRGVEPH